MKEEEEEKKKKKKNKKNKNKSDSREDSNHATWYMYPDSSTLVLSTLVPTTHPYL